MLSSARRAWCDRIFHCAPVAVEKGKRRPTPDHRSSHGVGSVQSVFFGPILHNDPHTLTPLSACPLLHPTKRFTNFQFILPLIKQYSPHLSPRAQPYSLSPGRPSHPLSPAHQALQLSPGPAHHPLRSPVTPPHLLQSQSPSSPLSFIHGPGQQVQLAPLHGPGSTSHSGLIDPCNLFCKVSCLVLRITMDRRWNQERAGD